MSEAIQAIEPAEAPTDAGDGGRVSIVIQGEGSGHVGSLDSVCSMVETIKALLRHADVAATGLEDAVKLDGAVLQPDARIQIRVPSNFRGTAEDLFTSLGRCVAVATGDPGTKLRQHEAEMAGTLAAILGGSGWSRIRLTLVEDDWEAVALTVPGELRSSLARLMPRPTLGKGHFGH